MMIEYSREQADKIWRTADPALVNDLALAVCRGLVAYDARLPSGCLTAITKSILFMLEERKTGGA